MVLPGEGQSGEGWHTAPRRAAAGGATATKTTKDEDKCMATTDKYIGLDVHQDTAVIAVAEADARRQVEPHAFNTKSHVALNKHASS